MQESCTCHLNPVIAYDNCLALIGFQIKGSVSTLNKLEQLH